MHQSQFAPHDTNEQRSALSPNAYFYSRSGHIFFDRFLSGWPSVFGAAQVQGAGIRGKVVADIPDQRKALPGVVVTLSSDRLGDKKIQSVSDMDGQYEFPGLIAGEYTVTMEFSGFKKYEKKLSVQIEATVEHDILLQPLPLSESVTVTDDRTDAVKTESTAPSVITNQALRDAPLIDQKFQDALPLLPGVVRGPDGNLNIKGTRPNSERHSRFEFERYRSGHWRAGDRIATRSSRYSASPFKSVFVGVWEIHGSGDDDRNSFRQ